jgi:hypothetical protein
LENLLFPHLQKHERGQYQSKTKGTVAMLRGKTTTLKGSREVLAIGGTRMVLRRSRSGIKEEKEQC